MLPLYLVAGSVLAGLSVASPLHGLTASELNQAITPTSDSTSYLAPANTNRPLDDQASSSALISKRQHHQYASDQDDWEEVAKAGIEAGVDGLEAIFTNIFKEPGEEFVTVTVTSVPGPTTVTVTPVPGPTTVTVTPVPGPTTITVPQVPGPTTVTVPPVPDPVTVTVSSPGQTQILMPPNKGGCYIADKNARLSYGVC